MKLRICSEGHAQLKPSLNFRSTIALTSYARDASPTLDIQEYINKMCSLEHYSTQSCYRVLNGTKLCAGEQRIYHYWMTVPKMLIFDPEQPSDYTKDLDANGTLLLGPR